FSEAFKEVKHRIFYSVKANFNINVVKVFYNLGSGIDVNSEGEFYRALKAGVKPEDMLMTGVGKIPDEIRLALEKNMLMIKAESEEEINLINEIAGKMNKKAPVRSEEHTSELQSRENLVCRLLLEKKKKKYTP